MPAFEAIASTTLGSNSTSVTFSSIPSEYRHLHLRMFARSPVVQANNVNLMMRFNSDSGTNYLQNEYRWNGTSESQNVWANQTHAFAGFVTGANGGTNIFGACLVDIFDYASTNKWKTVQSLNGNDTNGAGILSFYGSLWQNTAAITSIEIKTLTGSDQLITGSVFSLYGIRGA